MDKNLHHALMAFRQATGLSAHRVGILAAGNGRLIDRLEGKGRVWPETEEKAWAFLNSDKAKSIKARRSAQNQEATQ